MKKIIINKEVKKSSNFSVLICVYYKDNPAHFYESLNSIVKQTVSPSEIVVIIDGPIPEDTEKVVSEFNKNKLFNIIRLEKNVGHGEARRVGLDNCNYELVALMDADDISVPDRFEKQINFFEEDETLSIVGGKVIEFIDSTSNIVGAREVPTNDALIKQYMKKRCPFNQPTVMFKKSAVNQAGGYIDWHHEEDYFLWIRMAQTGSVFKNSQDNLVFMRVGKEFYNRRGGYKYFISEAKLQKYMLENKIIDNYRFLVNVSLRFILQVMLPTQLRGFIFRQFART